MWDPGDRRQGAQVRLTDTVLAAVGAVTGFGGLFAGAACCVLPLALASIGIGAGGLASLSPFHTPLSAVALIALLGGWYLYLRRRRACAAGASREAPARATPIILTLATLFVFVSGIWPFIEAPLMRLFEQ